MKYFIPVLFILSFQIGAQTNFDKAETCFKKQQYTQSKILFEKNLEQFPNDFKSIEYLGDIQCHLGNWESAIPYYQKLKSRKPEEAEYFYKYGGAMAMTAKHSNAFKALSMLDAIKAAFQQTLLLNPKHIGARWALIEIYLQTPSWIGGSEKRAIQYAKELSQFSAVDGYLSRGHIEEFYKRYPQAEIQYKKAIEAGNSQTTFQKLAELYKNKMDQPEKAKQLMAAYNEKNKS